MSKAPTSTDPSSPSDAPEASARPTMSVRRKLALLVVFLLVVAGLAEGGLRAAYFVYRGSWNFIGEMDQRQKLYSPHPYTCYQVVPHITIETYRAKVHTNRWGNRGPDQPYEKALGKVRIVTLGGSTTFNIYASDDAHTWPAQVERLLNEHYNTDRVAVINYSAPGFNSAESLTTFALRAIDRDPNIVIVHHGWNDLTAAIDPGFQADYTHRRKVAAVTTKPWWYKLAVYRFYVVMRGRYYTARRPAGTTENVSARAMGVYERNLESIVLLAEPRGIEPVLVTMASRLAPDDDPDAEAKAAEVEERIHKGRLTPAGLVRGIRAGNDCMRRVAERRSCLLVDLANDFPRDEDNFVEGDFGHKSDQGLEIFARLVVDAMIEDGTVERALAAEEEPAATGAAEASSADDAE